jgi:transposase, IS30 family
MKYQRLGWQERDQICVRLASGESIRHIAGALMRSASTISREVKRLSHKHRCYQPILSQSDAIRKARSRRYGQRKILLNLSLRGVVLEKLSLRWSPEQIANFLKLNYEDQQMQISKETIYNYIYVYLRRNMREEFIKYMRQGRKVRRAKGSGQKKKNTVLGDFDLIDERPEEATDRKVPGHWEGDLIIGGAKEQTALGTLVERTTRFLILVPLQSKSAEEVRTKFSKAINALPEHLKRSLTYDQGSEMAQHKKLAEETQMKVYFAHPRSPWERGTNENTNGLVRQFFPKGTNFKNVTPNEIRKVQDMLNERPRKTLNWMTPAQKINELLR